MGTDHATARLPREFYARPAPEVAPDLLGCVLEHETADGLVAVELTEVEAYAGEGDPASHAYRGKTARNAVMFGPPGHAYVYFTYGMHFCMNVVCGPPGVAVAVLLRAGRIVVGEDLARARRSRRAARKGAAVEPAGVLADRDTAFRDTAFRDLARGPARLCQALAIDRAQDGADLCAPASMIRLREPAVPPSGAADTSTTSTIQAGPRVGVRMGAEIAWRFWIEGDPTVSVYRPHAGAGLARPGRTPPSNDDRSPPKSARPAPDLCQPH
jgi:DNA-3-methyladenine glycosylase